MARSPPLVNMMHCPASGGQATAASINQLCTTPLLNVMWDAIKPPWIDDGDVAVSVPVDNVRLVILSGISSNVPFAVAVSNVKATSAVIIVPRTGSPPLKRL